MLNVMLAMHTPEAPQYQHESDRWISSSKAVYSSS
jgi:hypothetical protein